MARFKVLRLVVSHVHLYKKLDEFGKDYNSSVKAMVEQDRKWLVASAEVLPEVNEDDVNDSDSEESDGDDSETQSTDGCEDVPVTAAIPCPILPSNGQKITIDNIDYREEVHYMTKDHQTKDNHYLTVCATANRIHGNHLGSTTPVDGLKEMYNGSCIPSHLEQSAQRGDYISLVERIVVDYVPCLGFLKGVVAQHIPHVYSQETSSPTETVSLTIICLFYENIISPQFI